MPCRWSLDFGMDQNFSTPKWTGRKARQIDHYHRYARAKTLGPENPNLYNVSLSFGEDAGNQLFRYAQDFGDEYAGDQLLVRSVK